MAEIQTPVDQHFFKQCVADQLACSSRAIEHLFAAQTPLVVEISEYVMGQQGKRIRPTVVLLAAGLLGLGDDNIIQLAAIIELLHVATLLHDDVLDDSNYRRGKSTVHEVWDAKTSILAGDLIYAIAFEAIASIEHHQVIKALSKATNIVVTGEIEQGQYSGSLALTEAQYFNLIGKKTAALFAVAAKLPAIYADLPLNTIDALDTFGQALGMVYQLGDDWLDFFGNTQDLGKAVGDDFHQGKVTLPVLYLYQQARQSECRWIESLYQAESAVSTADLEALKALMLKYKVNTKIQTIIQSYVGKAQAALNTLPKNSYHGALNDLLNWSINRQI